MSVERARALRDQVLAGRTDSPDLAEALLPVYVELVCATEQLACDLDALLDDETIDAVGVRTALQIYVSGLLEALKAAVLGHPGALRPKVAPTLIVLTDGFNDTGAAPAGHRSFSDAATAWCREEGVL